MLHSGVWLSFPEGEFRSGNRSLQTDSATILSLEGDRPWPPFHVIIGFSLSPAQFGDTRFLRSLLQELPSAAFVARE
jgi:hypothetical protein